MLYLFDFYIVRFFSDPFLAQVQALKGSLEVLLTAGLVYALTYHSERQLQQTNQRLEAFAGIVSHDLKNPLNVASGRLELAREECDSEHLDSIADAHKHMSELIEDLLALSRQGRWTGETEPVNLKTMSINCWQTVTGTEPSIRIETEKRILADPAALRQVFGNLFTNAVQYTGPNVTITVGELADGFYIEDDGPGIPNEERELVFEPRHSIVEDGTGFGLTIVKQIIEAHGWEIRIVGGSDGGARFEITGVEFAE
ncbi:hypothetical protein Harman_04130 [Haloarcula mannanilytica]|uniref:histidine kinase n=1 Tax=Haloarcula mannanilytica TaxID=2509225 RepID=A0A4C2ED68_9EURY|nr:HAMP domain-containing sensor histidine kinase [Haloarcula mannanilytica]GCF12478.1 hypothetical protein Harman_04130 [Haloarcula mannanilytica]